VTALLATAWTWVKGRALAGWVTIGLGIVTAFSWVAWRMRERRLKRQERERAELAHLLGRTGPMDDTLVVTAQDARAIKAQFDHEVEERVRAIRAEADRARQSIVRRFGSRVIQTSKNEDLKK